MNIVLCLITETVILFEIAILQKSLLSLVTIWIFNVLTFFIIAY